MKIVFTVLTVSFFAGSAFACVDEGINSLGAYFDADGNVNCFVPAPFQVFDLYWILANPEGENLTSFEFEWAFSPAVMPMISYVTLPPNSLNVGTNFHPIVGLMLPLPTSGCATLMSISMAFDSPVNPEVYITVRNGSAGGIPVEYSTVNGVNVIIGPQGWVNPGVAKMSCPGPAAIEGQTWGNVKTLFR